MEERKIEAWTGPARADDSTMIGALVQAADGSIKQIDDSLIDALKLHYVLGGSPENSSRRRWDRLLNQLHVNSGYPNADPGFRMPWGAGND